MNCPHCKSSDEVVPRADGGKICLRCHHRFDLSKAETHHANEVVITRETYEQLVKDKERLDYLEAAHVALNQRYGTDYG
jgi:hypothetical protein